MITNGCSKLAPLGLYKTIANTLTINRTDGTGIALTKIREW